MRIRHPLILAWLVCLMGGGPLLRAAQPDSCPADFAGYLPPRLQAGDPARVSPGGDPNRLREQPSRSGAQVGTASPGSWLDVLAGPICDPVDAIIWWQVRAGSVTGWMAEGLLPGDYFMEPTRLSGPGVITPDNVTELIPLVTLPVGARTIFFTADMSQLALSKDRATAVYMLPDFAPSQTLLDVPIVDSGVCCLSRDGRYFIRLGERDELIDASTGAGFPLPVEMRGASDVVIRGGESPLVIAAIGEGYGSETTPQLLLFDPLRAEPFLLQDNPNNFGGWLGLNLEETTVAVSGNELRLYTWPPDDPLRPGRWRALASFGSSDVSFRPGPVGEIAAGGVSLFNPADGSRRDFPITRGDIGAQIGFHPNGDLLAVITRELEGAFGGEPRFHLYAVDAGTLLLESDQYTGAFAFSPDGRLLAVSDGNTMTWILGIAD
jgi:hypothetical protein